MKSILFVCCCCILLLGCYDPKLGCDDVYASNYDFTADEVCETDCCVYPTIQLNMKYLFGDVDLVLKDTLVNDIGDKFLLLTQRLYIGGVSLKDTNGLPLEMLDSLVYTKGNASVTLSDNMAFFKDKLNSFTLSAVRFEGKIDSLTCILGIDDRANYIHTASLTKDNVLSTENNLLLDSVYQSYYFQVVAGPTLTDTLSLYFDQDVPFKLKNTTAEMVKRGTAVKVNLQVDYSKWFSGVPFSSGNKEVIKQKISSNTQNVISFY